MKKIRTCPYYTNYMICHGNQMTKVLSYPEDKKVNVIVITSFIVFIIISSFFILSSSDQGLTDYNALLMSAISIGVAMVISLAQVFRYKKSIRKQGSIFKMSNDKQLKFYSDYRKMKAYDVLFPFRCLPRNVRSIAKSLD